MSKMLNLIDLSLSSYNEDIPAKSGIYRIILVSPDGNIIPVPRLLGTDNLGVLYVGSSSNLFSRLADIKKSLPFKKNDKDVYVGGTHQFGVKAKKLYKFADMYGLTNIRVTIKESNNFILDEIAALETYHLEFGELPPFNDRL